MAVLKNPIVLVGMKHSGKSSAGIELSKQFHTGFTDIDKLAEKLYASETGIRMTAREIYNGGGKEVFQSYELKASSAIAEKARKEIFVSAAGGGICDNLPAVEKLGKICIFVFIYEEPDVLFNRIMKNGLPAFLSKEDPREDFFHLFESRNPEYEKMADIKIVGGKRPMADICRDIITGLLEEGYAG